MTVAQWQDYGRSVREACVVNLIAQPVRHVKQAANAYRSYMVFSVKI